MSLGRTVFGPVHVHSEALRWQVPWVLSVTAYSQPALWKFFAWSSQRRVGTSPVGHHLHAQLNAREGTIDPAEQGQWWAEVCVSSVNENRKWYSLLGAMLFFSWDALAPKMVMSLRTRLTISKSTSSAIAFMAFSKKHFFSSPPCPKKNLFSSIWMRSNLFC